MKKRLLSLLLIVALALQFSVSAFAAVLPGEAGVISLTDENGNVIESHPLEEWAALYPSGIFAFKETQVNLREDATDGSQRGTLTVYRIGGTTGKAAATVTLYPAVARLENDLLSYANAAGIHDYRVRVEAPWAIAEYQSWGAGDPVLPGDALAVDSGVYFHAPSPKAERVQWQIRLVDEDSMTAVGDWSDIKDATDLTLSITLDMVDYILEAGLGYDIRCFYDLDGKRYCSESWYLEETYVPAQSKTQVPPGFIDDRTRYDYDIIFDGAEYDSYSFEVVFAEDEWEKEITFEALSDTLHETAELVTVAITDAKGAEINMSACTASVAIQDDEPIIPSAMGFTDTVLWADKAAGSIRIPLTRITEGLQYVTGVDYTTLDGTATAGRDYAQQTGTALFPSDLDYTTIEIDLVNDNIPLTADESGLYFTVALTAAKGGDSTLIEGRSTITVRLYNSLQSSGAGNIATDLYSPDEEDLTRAVGEAPAIVPSGDTVYAEAVDPGKNVTATYSLSEFTTVPSGIDGVGTYTYLYPGQLYFDDPYLMYYSADYWRDAALMAEGSIVGAHEHYDNQEGFLDNKSYWKFKSSGYDNDHGIHKNSGDWHFHSKGEGYMYMTVPDLFDRYTGWTFSSFCNSKKGASIFPCAIVNGKITKFSDYNYSNPLAVVGEKSKYYGKGGTQALRPEHDGVGIYSTFLGKDSSGEHQARLSHGTFVRRTISMPMVRIFTADDSVIEGSYATLFDAIKPTVELVAGQGGVARNGMLYNNSQLKISRGPTAGTYRFATTANNQLGKSIFLSAKDASTIWSSTTPSGDTATFRALQRHDGNGNFEAQTYLNVVMDRKQSVSLNILPSVPRKVEGGKEINSSRIGEAWDSMWAEIYRNSPSGITVTYRDANFDFSGGKDGFSAVKTRYLTKSDFPDPTKAGGTAFETAALKNIRSINFNLSPEDRILFGNDVYNGNDNIPIDPSVFMLDRIPFVYYDEEYRSSESTMVATIVRVERYVDINDDGVIKGSIAPDGSFAADSLTERAYDPTKSMEENAGATYYVLPSMTEDSYSITELSPRLGDDGKFHEIILKAYYSMVPRALERASGDEGNNTAEIVPAIVTSITTPILKSALTNEMQGYRYLDHHGTGAGHPMYGKEAGAITFVDIPMGGDFNPPTAVGGEISWSPIWIGSPYAGASYTEQPEPIYLDDTAVGDHYPVGDLNELDTDRYQGPTYDLDKKVLDKEGKETTLVELPPLLSETGKAKVVNYLAAIHADDTFALCIRETRPDAPTDGLIGGAIDSSTVALGHTLVGIESSTLGDFFTIPTTISARQMADPMASSGSEANPNKEQNFDSGKAGSDMPEYNMAGSIAMPSLDIGLTDFVSITMTGQELAISIGTPLAGFGGNTKVEKQDRSKWKATGDPGTETTPASAGRETMEMMKSLVNTFSDRSGSGSGGKNVKEYYDSQKEDYFEKIKEVKTRKEDDHANNRDAGRSGIHAAGVSCDLGISLTMILKWNPIEREFFFNKMIVVLAAGIEFAYTVRLTPCPIFYCTITLGFSVEVAAGLEASRIKVIGSDFNLPLNTGGAWKHYTDQNHLGSASDDKKPENKDFSVGLPGASFSVKTKEKAVDIQFSGMLLVEGYEADGKTKLKDFAGGTIRSNGDEPVTIKLADKVDGKNNKDARVLTFTVVSDDKTRVYEEITTDSSGKKISAFKKLPTGAAIVDRVVTIDRQTFDVYFTGFNISPEIFMELAVGIGFDLLKIELFINITIGCSFQMYYSHDSETYEGEDAENKAFNFNEFNLIAGIGLRVTALFFNFQFDAVQLAVTYDRLPKFDEMAGKNKGWNVIWYGANQPIHKHALLDAPSAAPENVLQMNIILPGALRRDEQINSPEDNLASAVNPFAFDPSDSTVPFQYSGYGTTGDAFTLGSELAPGSTYELVSTNGKNYMVYTVSDGDSINQSRLVLSEVRETAIDFGDGIIENAYGLAHPIDPASSDKYLKLDNDATGDLEFDAWVDGIGRIHIAWISYTDSALAAYQAALTAGSIAAMTEAGKHTTVKSRIVDPATAVLGDVLTVSNNAEGHGMYMMPSGATNAEGRDMIFYAEAAYYTPTELAALNAAYDAFYGAPVILSDGSSGLAYGEGDPSAYFQSDYTKMRMAAFGKSFYPTFALSSEVADATAPGTTKTVYTLTRVKADSWLASGVRLENADLTAIENDFYVAYTTAQSTLLSVLGGTPSDEQTIKKLYLQRISVTPPVVSPTTGVVTTPEQVTVGAAVGLRHLVDVSRDSAKDGVYAGASLQTAYTDPYFSNVQFLRGKLGALTGDPEDFNDIVNVSPFALGLVTPENFLIFEMNANTYVIPEASLRSITDPTAVKRSGMVIPFFTRQTAQEITDAIEKDEFVVAEVKGAPAVTNVTIGADGNGNITAVYTQGVPNAPGNAVYMTKYDPQSMTWGLGTMLAMRDMQTFEDAVAGNWSVDETVTAYFDTTEDGMLTPADTPQSFSFNRLRIGLAGQDKLLVVSEGTLMQLEAVPQMAGVFDDAQNLVGLAPVTDGNAAEDAVGYSGRATPAYTFNAAMRADGSYDSENGIYAISFGMGKQALGSAAIHLSNYTLTPGSQASANVTFTNTGDVAIRASAANPATITLYAKTASGNEPLAAWHVTENIRAGQEVRTEDTVITFPATLTCGDLLYFGISEDATYVLDHFSANTDREDAAYPAVIVVEDLPELGYEHFDLHMISANDDADTVKLAADIHVGNRGSKASPKTYLRFQYEKTLADGSTVIAPLDLRGHNLSISDQIPLPWQTFSTDARTLENGYLLLRTTENGIPVNDENPGEIKSMYGRTVTGTFDVPKSCFNTGTGTGSLNLIVTIESYHDEITAVQNSEYNPANNVYSPSIEPRTFFSVTPSFTAQVGSTLRLPISMTTSTLTSPTITLTELVDGEEGARNLSVLYYDAAHDAIVVMPGELPDGQRRAEGKIRVADTTTHTYYDICYAIEAEGVGLNIYNDNGIFTWYDINGEAGKTGEDAWTFRDSIASWESGVIDKAPLRNDLAIADANESFAFATQAGAIDIFFMGMTAQADVFRDGAWTKIDSPATIRVSSTLADFTTKTITSNNGEQGVRITFNNPGSATHVVTVKAVSDNVRFDRIVETFAEDMVIRSDPTAPGIYFNRSPLPAPGSIKQGNSLYLIAFAADIGGLNTFTTNLPDATLNQTLSEGGSLWSLSAVIRENGVYTFTATDRAGNVTTRELTVDWFSATLTENTDRAAPALWASTVTDKTDRSVDISMLHDAALTPVISRMTYDDPEKPTAQYFTDYAGEIIPNANGIAGSMTSPNNAGIYRIAVTDPVSGTMSYFFVCVEQDKHSPIVTFTRSEDGNTIHYTAEKTGTDGKVISPITQITLHAPDPANAGRIIVTRLLDANASGYRFSGSIPVTGFGEYRLIVTDREGNTTTATVDVGHLTLTYNKNHPEATGAMAQQAITGSAATLATADLAFKRLGWSLKGWSKYPDGKTPDGQDNLYAPGSTFTDHSGRDLTLYAIWTINRYSVTVQPHDPVMGTAAGSCEADYLTLTRISATPKTNYIFTGWRKQGTSTILSTDNPWVVFVGEGGAHAIYEAVFALAPAYLTAQKAVARTMADELAAVIAAMPDLTAAQKQAFDAALDAAVAETDRAIDAAVHESDVLDALDDLQTALDAIRFTAYQDNNHGTVAKLVEENLLIIDRSFRISSLNKEGYRRLIREAAREADAAINAARTQAEVDAAMATLRELLKQYIDTSVHDMSWLMPITYTLTFETNGGSSIAPQRRMLSNEADLTRFVPTREGYTFVGWYLDRALTIPVTTHRMRGDVTVYAGWVKTPTTPTQSGNA